MTKIRFGNSIAKIFGICLLSSLWLCANAQSLIEFSKLREEGIISYSIIQSDLSCYKVKVKINGLYDVTVSNSNASYQRIWFEDGFSLSNVGEPELPVLSQNIVIPEGSSYKVEIKENKWEEIKVKKIYPVQKPFLMSEKQEKFEINEEIYNRSVFQPQLLREGNVDNWNGIRSVGLMICPFKYYPQSGRLSVLTEFEILVDFVSTSKNQTANESILRGNDAKHFDNINENSAKLTTGSSVSNCPNDYNYLIIIGNLPDIINSQELQDFRKWKALKGYRTKVATTNIIGSTDNAIKQYIAQEYEHGVRYVLFIGKADKIPLHEKTITIDSITTRTAKGDYWYGCIDANKDYLSRLAIGRFSTNSLSELRDIVNKTIKYESKTNSYCNKVLLVAHHQRDSSMNFQNACQWLVNRPQYFPTVSCYTAYGASIADGGENATNAQVIEKINDGMHIITYMGHGLNGLWGDGNWNASGESFTADEIDSMDVGTNSIFLNYACRTADISVSYNMLESFLNSNHGAVGLYGATTDVYYGSNLASFRNFFIGLYRKDIYNLGDLTNYSYGYYQNIEYRTYTEYNEQSYILGGDPTLEVWTNSPQPLEDVLITFSSNSTIVSSSSVSDYSVSIVSEDGDLLTFSESGEMNRTFPNPSGNFYISINKHNYLPYVVYVNTASHYLQNKTIEQNEYYMSSPFSIGYDVTNTYPLGSVVVKDGANLKIKNSNSGVLIKNGFECEQGAEFAIE